MKRFTSNALSQFVKYAFFLGFAIGILCLFISYKVKLDSRVGSLFINLSADFFMAGLTISVVDRLIKRSERQRYGNVPDAARTAINNEVWSLVGLVSYLVKDVLTKNTQEIIDSGLVSEAYKDGVDLLVRINIMQLAQLKVIDDTKLTLGMFSETLRFIRETLAKLDNLIARYGLVLDAEDISKALGLRNDVEKLGESHSLTTLTIPFFGQETPNKLLEKRQRSAFLDIRNGIVNLTDKLL